MKDKSILFVGQAYYNAWYLSRELRKLGWKADVLNFDPSPTSQMFYHGEDFKFEYDLMSRKGSIKHIEFFLEALDTYQIFHFSNKDALYFLNLWDLNYLQEPRPLLKKWYRFLWKNIFKSGKRFDRLWRLKHKLGNKITAKLLYSISPYLNKHWDIHIIKYLKRKITYTNNGCLDGVLQTSFNQWSTPIKGESVCDICLWKNNSDVCSDEKNATWGEFRNAMADYQFLLGGNRADYNIGKNILEMPYFYCLDENIWKPDLLIPSNYKLPIADNIVKIYHAVGNFDKRSRQNKTIKSTHIYIPLITKLKKEGFAVELLFFKDVPNIKVRYYQLQADIFVDMLTFGFFGANIREGMMLGKPCVCYLRPEWLEQMRAEIPEYVDELPIINATPNNIEAVLKDLIKSPKKRLEIGQKSREFAIKWHGSRQAAKFFDGFFFNLLK